MFEDNSYKAHEAHNDLYEALQKSLELDYSNQCLADQEEARKKKRKKCAALRTPSGSPPSPPPTPPPPVGASGAPGSAQQQGSKAPSSSKPVVSIHQSMAWTTYDTRLESTGFTAAQELSPIDSLIQDDSIPDEQVHLSDDEYSGNDHLPKADSRQDWSKPLPEVERPATPEPAWTIPSSNVLDIENNWASTLVSTYETPAENLLLAKTGDMTTFLKWYYRQVDWTNLEGDHVRINVNRPLPLDGPPSHVTIQPKFFFNKDLEYLRYGSKGSNHALSISKMKAASYPDFRLELLVPEQIHYSLSCRKDVKTHMRILSVVRIKAYSRYGYDYLSKIVLRRADFQEHMITEKDFKNLYPSDFEDLNLLLLQGHLDHLPGYEFKHDYTIIESYRAVVFLIQGIQGQAAQFGYEYEILDSKGRDKEQRVHSGY
ncbi:hypothetical protein Tco_1555718 [Tanacetum coccineum]